MQKLTITYIKQLQEAASAHLALLNYNYLNKAMKSTPRSYLNLRMITTMVIYMAFYSHYYTYM
jgi:hypothetical protein